MVDSSSTQTLNRLAIDAALNQRWAEALEINKELNKLEPENIECLNRLAKAYFELGKYSQTKKIYQEVLKLDPYNTIAQKNLKKVSVFKKNADPVSVDEASNGISHTPISPDLFLEEPGVTKVVTLVKVAEPQKLVMLSSGMNVNLVLKNRGICVTYGNNNYLGALPDDTSHHLLKLIKGGNKYMAIIKSIKYNSITLLLREVFRSKKFKNQASFIDGSRALTYSSDNISLFTGDNDDETPDEDMPTSEELPV